MAIKSINPHNPYEVIGEFEEVGPYDVEIAVVRAREAYFEWREQPASVRGGAPANIADDVEKWAEELVRFTVMETGKRSAQPGGTYPLGRGSSGCPRQQRWHDLPRA